MVYKTEGVASRGRAGTEFPAAREGPSAAQHCVRGQHECWAKARRTVTGAGCDGVCRT